MYAGKTLFAQLMDYLPHISGQYSFRVTWSEEDQEQVGLCVEFPGLSWLDKKPETALIGIGKLVYDCVNYMQLQNETVPEPVDR